MPKYKVFINGTNLHIDMEGRRAKYGFYTTRFVEGPVSAAAENAAVESIRQKQTLRDVVRNAPDDPPCMYLTSSIEVESFDGIKNLELGFAFYEETPKRWWQLWRQ